jgi:hypothetical protein
MVDEPSRISTWTLRVVVYGGAVAGLALVVAALRSADPPGWWLPVGIPLAVIGGGLASIWIGFRLRHRTAGARQQAFERMAARRVEVGRPLDRSRLAYRATRHKRAVLRSGVDATAVVTFLADGHRANEYRHLVYLELEVSRPGREPYPVQTGEFLNPASAGSVAPGRELRVKVDPDDPQRVAVDWERSLRLD